MAQSIQNAGHWLGFHAQAWSKWRKLACAGVFALGGLLSSPSFAAQGADLAQGRDAPRFEEVREVMFVEDNIRDWQLLAVGARPGVAVVQLDSRSNGLLQMSTYLDGRRNLSAIHLISHGAVAQLDLGTFSLSAANLMEERALLQRIGQSLKTGGDFLLYGCDVAKGEEGKRFVGEIAAISGANVAASDNLTGAGALGGDWILEAVFGKIRTDALLTASAQSQYQYVLPTALTTPTTITFAGASTGNVTSSYDFGGLTFSVNGAGQIDVTSDVAAFLGITLGNFSGNGIVGDYNWTGSTANSVTTFTLAANANTKFKMTSLDVAAGNSGPAQVFTLTGYTGGAGGTQVAQITSFNIAALTNQTYSNGTASQVTATVIGPLDNSGYGQHLVFAGTNWQYVDTIVFSAFAQNDVLLAFDNLVLDNPVLPTPIATTGSATGISATSATLNGTVNDNGASTTVTFDYGLTTGYGTNVAATTGGTVGAGSGATATAVTITGLSCNTTYHFRVKGVNGNGTTNGNDASFTTSKCPQTITFNNPGSQSFGTSPTLTATASSGLTPSFTSSTTGVCTITSGGTLTFVTSGTCTINADQAGDSTYAAAAQVQQSFSVAAVVPGAPTIGTATAGDTQVSVSFSAPGSNGGATITSYTATASPGGATASAATSPITVTGLTNGTSYTFTVTAFNSAGTGSASAASNSATPKGAQTITFANPGAQNFGTSPTLTATATSGLTTTFTSSTTGVCTITVGGTLTFVTAGTCTINADQAGNGSFDAAPQVQRSFTVNAIVPGAPTIGTATAGDTQASVTFTAPASNGGATITSYTAIASPGGATGTGGASPVVVTGLTNGVVYTFTVTATNSAGTGSASAASNSVTPKATQTITFSNPGAQNFGTTPTLTATSDSGLTVTFTSATTGVCTITSGGALTFVTTGTCTINADQAGNGSYLAGTQVQRSFTVNAVVPGAPVIGTAAAGDTQATVTFTAPAFTGGATITGYTVTSNPGGLTNTGAASPITVSGLTNGLAYTFTVTATNSAGTGSASAASNSVTPNPGPAVVSVAVPANGSYSAGQNLDFTVTWDSNTTVTGTPNLALTIGATTVQASYVSSPTATTTLFRYTVLAGQTDTDGITIGALTLNGGTIRMGPTPTLR